MKQTKKVLKKCLSLIIAASMVSIPVTYTSAAALTPAQLASQYATPKTLSATTKTDSASGRQYKLLSLSGTDIIRPYFTAQQWNNAATKFIFGVADGADDTNGAMLEYDVTTGKARFLDYADASTKRLEAYVNPQDKIFYEKFNSSGKIEYWVMDWSTYEKHKIAELPDGIKAGRNVVATNDGNYMSVQWQTAEESGDEGSVLARLDTTTGEFFTDRTYSFKDKKLGHPMINPANEDLMMFCHEGDDDYTADRIWVADMTGAFKPWQAFIQAREYYLDEQDKEQTLVTEPATHELWQGNGEAIVFVKSLKDGNKGESGLVRVKPNGADREYFPNPEDYAIWHATTSYDGNFIAGDAKPTDGDTNAHIVLYDTRTYDKWCLVSFNPGYSGSYDNRRGWAYDPYQFHPTISNNANKICWEMYDSSKSTYGFAWMDISNISGRAVTGGVSSYSSSLNYVSYSGTDFEIDEETYQGKNSLHIQRDGMLYLDVKDSLGKAQRANGRLTFKYYDSGTSDIVVKYTSATDSEANVWKQEDEEVTFTCTDTNAWVEKTIEMNNMSLDNSCKHLSDIVICTEDNLNVCDLAFEIVLDSTPAYDNTYFTLQNQDNSAVSTVTTGTWWRNGTTVNAETVNLGRNAIKVRRGNSKSLIVKFKDDLKELDTVKVSFDLWGTCQWQTGSIRYADENGTYQDKKKLQVNDFKGWKHYEYEVSTKYNLASFGCPADTGFAITYTGNEDSEELWIANLKVDIGTEWSLDAGDLNSEGGYSYTNNQLKVVNNNAVWTAIDNPEWYNSEGSSGTNVTKQLDQDVFVITRGNDKYFVVTFGDQIRANNVVKVDLNLWGTKRWQNGNIIYKGTDGTTKDEQIGVKFDHFEPYSKTMKTDFDLTSYGRPGEKGFVIVYKGTGDEKLWIKDINVSLPETTSVEIVANSNGTGYTEMFPCGIELTGTRNNQISGAVLRDGNYGIGYQYKNVNGTDAFYLTQMYDTNASNVVDVVKGYMGFKVDTDKFPKSPTATKNLYLITEYYDGTVGDITTKDFAITYTAKSYNWDNSSATNIQMTNDNTWKTHIMPLGDIYFGVTNAADSAAVTYRIPTANNGYNKNGILIKRVALVDEMYLRQNYNGAGIDGATTISEGPEVIFEEYDDYGALEYKVVSLANSVYDGVNQRVIIGRPGRAAIVFGEKYTSQESPVKVHFKFTGARQWQNGTFQYVDSAGQSQSTMVQVNANQAIRSYAIAEVKTNAGNLNIAGNTESGCIIEYTGDGNTDYFAVSDIAIEADESNIVFEKYDDQENLEYKVIKKFDSNRNATYDSTKGEFKIYRPGKLAVVFGEKYQDPNKTYSVSFDFSGARQWQNGTVNYVQKNADGTRTLKSDGAQ